MHIHTCSETGKNVQGKNKFLLGAYFIGPVSLKILQKQPKSGSCAFKTGNCSLKTCLGLQRPMDGVGQWIVHVALD